MQESPTNESSPTATGRAPTEKQFRGWRLIGVIMAVIVVLAVVSAVVDWMVIGPLEGRMF